MNTYCSKGGFVTGNPEVPVCYRYNSLCLVFNMFMYLLVWCFILYLWSNSATFGEKVFQNGFASETILK